MKGTETALGSYLRGACLLATALKTSFASVTATEDEALGAILAKCEAPSQSAPRAIFAVTIHLQSIQRAQVSADTIARSLANLGEPPIVETDQNSDSAKMAVIVYGHLSYTLPAYKEMLSEQDDYYRQWLPILNTIMTPANQNQMSLQISSATFEAEYVQVKAQHVIALMSPMFQMIDMEKGQWKGR